MKRALVTGGTHGIGLAIVDGLRAVGWEVFTFSRTGGDVQADALIPADRMRVWHACGAVDALINNVGGGGRWGSETPHLTPLLTWEEVWQKNVGAMADFTAWALPGMLEMGWGRIVTISSIHGQEAGGRPWFAAAKAAQIAAMKSYARNLLYARRGITFNTVCPGHVEIEGKPLEPHMERLPMGRMGTTTEVADAVLWLCSDKARWVNGATISTDGAESLHF